LAVRYEMPFVAMHNSRERTNGDVVDAVVTSLTHRRARLSRHSREAFIVDRNRFGKTADQNIASCRARAFDAIGLPTMLARRQIHAGKLRTPARRAYRRNATTRGDRVRIDIVRCTTCRRARRRRGRDAVVRIGGRIRDE